MPRDDDGEIAYLAGQSGRCRFDAARNDAFDVTPAALVTTLITEHGPCSADAASLHRLAAGMVNHDR